MIDARLCYAKLKFSSESLIISQVVRITILNFQDSYIFIQQIIQTHHPHIDFYQSILFQGRTGGGSAILNSSFNKH